MSTHFLFIIKFLRFIFFVFHFSHPFNIFTDEILTATASCLMAQAEEGEFEKSSEEHIQGLILDQFGECLSQILNMASSNGVEE